MYKFQSEIREGKVYSFENMGVAANGGSYKTTHHPYKLNFQFGTKCLPLCGALVSGSDFKFVPISDIVGGSYDCDYLVGEYICKFSEVFEEYCLYLTFLAFNYFFYVCQIRCYWNVDGCWHRERI